ncbi:bacteriocin immunity protein [Lacticaseibacillus sp. GG6-2]
MTAKTDYEQIANLVSEAMADPEIAQTPELMALLTRIGDDALHQRDYYDYRNDFLPLVSSFARAHHSHMPQALLTLLKYVQTPKGWSGF